MSDDPSVNRTLASLRGLARARDSRNLPSSGPVAGTIRVGTTAWQEYVDAVSAATDRLGIPGEHYPGLRGTAYFHGVEVRPDDSLLPHEIAWTECP